MTERSVFIAALDIQDSGERSAYLDEVCQGNPRLRERVGALLRAHADANDFMDQPATEYACTSSSESVGNAAGSIRWTMHESHVESQESDAESSGWRGMRIGRYELLQPIGDGGFGVVYLAEQVEPVRRRVALKIIKPGMGTREVIARFDAERQALALMDHPNIAKVLDAGATSDTGRPYFVMELVSGMPITEYCDLNHATTRERLELFTSVCRAVQHAHQKGIIHRDLKPSNILVALQDNRPVPKVIDFGVAKALKFDLSEGAQYTACGQLIGTPAYMSPEQAELSGVDVDTRSDIYALGVLLYELLTGSTPLAERLQAGSYGDLLRIIREEETLQPSLRLAAMHDADLDLIARQRRSDPQRLRREVAGDLDWIVMKALEKERTRRFETAAGLARDVERFLQGETVEARPPSQLYQFQKFVRRHRSKFYLAASLVVLSALTIVGLSISNIRIRAEQFQTSAQRDRAEQALRLADARADENAELIMKIGRASTLVGRARVFKDWLHWDAADRTLSQAIELLPEYAAARTERGNLYAQLGLWELAAADLSVAVHAQEPDTTVEWLSHAILCRHVGDSGEYHRACTRMHELFDGTNRRRFAMDVVRACTIGPDTHGAPAQLVELAEAIVDVEPHDPEYLHVLGQAYYRAGQHESAIQRLREAAAIDPGWRSRAITLPVLAMACQALGRNDEARLAFDEAAAALDNWTRERYETLHPLWVVFDGGTSVWPVPWHDWLQCELQFQEAQQTLGLPAPDADPRQHVLRARSFAGVRRYDAANAEFDLALALRPDDTEMRAQAHFLHARFHAQHDQWREAAQEYSLARELRPEEPYLLHFQAVSHLAAGDLESYQHACTEMVERFGASHDPRAAHSVVELCTLVPNAVPDPQRLLVTARVAAEWYPGASRFHGITLYRCGEYQAAIDILLAADALHSATAGDLFFLGMAQYRLGNVDEARRTLEEAIAWIEQADREGPDDVRGTRPDWGRWDERIAFPLLQREAEALVSGTNQTRE